MRPILMLAALVATAPAVTPQTPPYDLVIAGGSVIDGDGSAPAAADVAIRDGRIVRIGVAGDAPASRRIDASGLTVSPGFIDIHNHSDYTVLSEPKR